MLMRAAPVVFVLLWSTGFIGSKIGVLYAEPFTFLALRFILALAILIPLGLLMGRQAASWTERGHAAIAGMLLHGVYLGGVLWALRHGMPAGVAALIVSLQPILTSLLSGPLLGERLTARHWTGLALGLAGAVLILAPKLETAALSASSGIQTAAIVTTVLALGGITAGTLYQKRFAGHINLVAGAVWQYIGALAVSGAAALALETRQVTWTLDFVLALAWLVIVISIGAIFLLMRLIARDTAARVSGLFYLVPAVTAVIAYFVFGETLDRVQMAGLALASLAVLMISGAKRAPAARTADA
jgi:drug/metabolite transporter (DMT)-like permease